MFGFPSRLKRLPTIKPESEDNLCEVPVYHASKTDLKDISTLITKIESLGFHDQCSIVKVIPEEPPMLLNPKEEALKIKIDKPAFQHLAPCGSGYFFQLPHWWPTPLSVQDILNRNNRWNPEVPGLSISDLEKEFWDMEKAGFRTVLYANDDAVTGKWFPEGFMERGKVLEMLLPLGDVPGVTNPSLYFGFQHTHFPIHMEDMDMYSILYLSWGERKIWYGTDPGDHDRMIETLRRAFREYEDKNCPTLYRHKLFYASPQAIEAEGIKVFRAVQKEGEFMITFPKGFHWGFNAGFNCAESFNFVTPRWIPIGNKAKTCKSNCYYSGKQFVFNVNGGRVTPKVKKS